MSKLIQNEILDDITYVYTIDDSETWEEHRSNIINPKKAPYPPPPTRSQVRELHAAYMEAKKKTKANIINPPVICNTKGVEVLSRSFVTIEELIASGRAPWYYLTGTGWIPEAGSEERVKIVTPRDLFAEPYLSWDTPQTLEEYQEECEKDCKDTRVELPLPELPQAAYDYLCSTAMPHGKKLIFDR